LICLLLRGTEGRGEGKKGGKWRKGKVEGRDQERALPL